MRAGGHCRGASHNDCQVAVAPPVLQPEGGVVGRPAAGQLLHGVGDVALPCTQHRRRRRCLGRLIKVYLNTLRWQRRAARWGAVPGGCG